MDKEKLIDLLDRQTFAYHEMQPESPEDYTAEYKKGYNEGLKFAIAYIDQLDEADEFDRVLLKHIKDIYNQYEYDYLPGFINDIKDGLAKQDEREQLETAYKDILNRGEFWFDGKQYKVVPKQDEPEKVPQKWFDILERNKDLTLETILRIVNPRKKGEEKRFVKAWLAYPNIEVEKEKKYEVKDKNDCFLLTKNSEGEVINAYSKVVYKNKGYLTEQEIKDYDERFWPFAVPVEEEEK